MFTGSTLEFQPLVRVQVAPPASAAAPAKPSAMTPFVEIPIDPDFRDRVRMTIAAQPEEHFKAYFNGRTPTPREKLQHMERSVELLTPIKVYQNNLYRVEIVHTPPCTPTYTHLSITRLD